MGTFLNKIFRSTQDSYALTSITYILELNYACELFSYFLSLALIIVSLIKFSFEDV